MYFLDGREGRRKTLKSKIYRLKFVLKIWKKIVKNLGHIYILQII